MVAAFFVGRRLRGADVTDDVLGLTEQVFLPVSIAAGRRCLDQDAGLGQVTAGLEGPIEVDQEIIIEVSRHLATVVDVAVVGLGVEVIGDLDRDIFVVFPQKNDVDDDAAIDAPNLLDLIGHGNDV